MKAHLSRLDEVCNVVRGVSVEGLTAEQIQKLKSKKRKPGVTTNEEKWQDIFAIVFPDARCSPDPCEPTYFLFLIRKLTYNVKTIPTSITARITNTHFQ